MNKDITRFSIQAAIIAVLLSVLNYLAFQAWFPKNYFDGFYGVYLFLFLATVLFHYILVSATAERPGIFVNRFVALTGARLLFYLTVIIVYVLLVHYQAISFMITFLIGYFVYTIFEVVAILQYLKKISPKQGSSNQ
jgi:hypothetical protein